MSEIDLTEHLIVGAVASSDLPGTYTEKRAAFRRWLNKKLAEAWDEGFEAGYADQRYRNTGKPMPVNPYRKED